MKARSNFEGFSMLMVTSKSFGSLFHKSIPAVNPFVYFNLGVVARPSTSLDFSEINKAKTMQTQVSSQNKRVSN